MPYPNLSSQACFVLVVPHQPDDVIVVGTIVVVIAVLSLLLGFDPVHGVFRDRKDLPSCRDGR
jgi:hypothetical protein